MFFARDRLFFLGGVLALTLFPSIPAAADSGDCSFSGALLAQSPLGGLVASGFRYGVSDAFSFELGVGVGAGFGDAKPKLQGLGTLELVAALDIFEWVPELAVGGGAGWTDEGMAPFASVKARLRWILDFNWSVFVGGGVDYLTEKSRFNGTGQLGFSYLLD